MTGYTSGELFGGLKVEDVSLHAKIVELEREIKKRQQVYARLVKQHRMSKREAETRIVVMKAILNDYYALNREAKSTGRCGP